MSDLAREGAETPSTPGVGPDLKGRGAGPGQHQPSAESDGLLAVVRNLSQYHREHEKYYSEASLTGAISLQRTARTRRR